jgi:hypothetical protein
MSGNFLERFYLYATATLILDYYFHDALYSECICYR